MNIEQFQLDHKEWAKTNKSLCFYPWSTTEIRLNFSKKGNFLNSLSSTCCCNLDISNLKTSKDSDPFSELKKEMNQGIVPKACHACFMEEKHNGISERVRDIMGKSFSELDEFYNSRKTTYYEVRINFSSNCNLACRSCDASSSSTFAKISKNFTAIHYEKDIIEHENLFQEIKNLIEEKLLINDKFYVHLMGGEPLISKGAKELLLYLVSTNLSQSIHLRITTSLVNLTDDLLTLIDNFKAVEFVCSIDSVHENYTYVRWPAQFSKIENNLNRLYNYKINSPSILKNNWDIIISPVFSLNNIFYIKECLDYWYQYFREKSGNGIRYFFVNTTLLHRTVYLDIQALPQKYRLSLINLLTECLDHPFLIEYNEIMIHLYNFLTSAITELRSWSDNKKLWRDFLYFTAEFDKRTSTQFELLNYKLFELLDTEDQDLFYSFKKNVDSTKILLIR